MKYRFLKGVVTEAGVRNTGDITDELTEYEIRVFLHYGKIEPVGAGTFVAREPVVENRDPVIEVVASDAPALVATERKRGRPRKL